MTDTSSPSFAQLMARLRFRQLALLASIGQHGNLHHAAEAMHLAQPSATKVVHDLEQLFNIRLFERLPRGMHPTDLGVEVLDFARRMLAELERFAQDLETKRKGGYGQLVIGAIMGAAPDFVARATAEMKQRRPLLAIRLMGETSDEIIDLLLEHKIDLAVGRFSNLLQHNAIDFEALGNEVLFIVARKGHPLRRVRRLRMQTLRECAWILQPLTSPARQVIEQEFGQAGMRTPANLVECTSIFATLQLLQKSDAVSLLPESVVRDHLFAGLLIRLPVTVGKSLPGFGILTRRGEPLSPTAAEFGESLRRYGALMGQDPKSGRREVRRGTSK
jgi:DNA-binding transcriptional LysR family regulator